MTTPIVVDEDEPEYDLDEPPFEPREVTLRKDKWVTDEFEILDFLGRGKFGEVKRCTEKSTGREFAAKFICAPRPQDKKDVEHELNIMKKLYHKRLIQLYDAFESKAEMCLVLEIIYGGELFDRVISDDFILTEKACMAFIRQICEGLEYMHHKMIIHLDMKPENVLCLTRTGNRIKIIDFGLAREYHPKKDLRVLFGTPEFMAPEVVQYETISFGTDMWSVGVICYVLLSGLSPFMGDTDADTLSNVIKSQYDFNYTEFDDVSDEAKDLISRLLVKDKNKRLTASECLRHPWLALPGKSQTLSPNLRLSKKRLKRFVYRRKWQKIVNAIIALRRMGFQLMALQKNLIQEKESPHKISDTVTELDIKPDDFQRSLELKGYDVNKRKASDSGYESVAVDKDNQKDYATDVEGTTPEADVTAGEICVSSVNISLDTAQSASPPMTDVTAEAQPVTQVFEATFNMALPSQRRWSRDQAKDRSRGSSKEPSPSAGEAKSGVTLPPHRRQSRDQVKDRSRGSSKEPSPSASEKPTTKPETGVTKKQSIIDKFGGLFLNYKDKGGTQQKKMAKKGSVKKSKEKEKDKAAGGIVKKDSFKRKVGPKGKEEVYVTTPVVRQKHPNFHHADVMRNMPDSSAEDPDKSNSNNDDRTDKSSSVSNRFKVNNGIKKATAAANGGPNARTPKPGSPLGGDGANGSSQAEAGDEDMRTPSILLGNVKNKRKLFENSGRPS